MFNKIFSKFQNLDRRNLLVAILVSIFFLFIISSTLIVLLTDYWWFQSLGYGSIWSKVIGSKVTLFLVFSIIGSLIIWVNLFLVDKSAPAIDSVTFASDSLASRYNAIILPRIKVVRVLVSAVVGMFVGSEALNQWQSWMLFRNGGTWGVSDPVFGKDVGFYVFKLPFYSFIVGWLVLVLILSAMLSIGAYFLNGSLNPALRSFRNLSSYVNIKLHACAFFAVFAAINAVQYYLMRFDTLQSDRGGYRGASATDIIVRLPGLRLLIVVAVISMVLFVLNTRRKGWGFSLIAFSLWGISHFIVLVLAPSIYQRLRVDPVRSVKEAPYVASNIEFTRLAYGLDKIDTRSLDYKPGISSENASKAEEVLKRVPLVDPSRADDEFNNNQTVREFYSFDGLLDVGRYDIGGEQLPVVLATRNLNLDRVPNNWEDRHVLNTHGYGVVVAASYEQQDQVRESGGEVHPLDYKIKGLGVEETTVDSDFSENYSEKPQIYYSEGFDDYSVIGATRDEIDYQSQGNKSVETRYDGLGGVRIDSLFRRAAFSIRFGEIDPLISSSLTSESKVLFNRDIRSRVKNVAPFLTIDSDPYPVVSDGRVFWLLDAYTTTDHYPYSSATNNSVEARLNSKVGYNYIRNSVKVVIDAYDGTVDLYTFDESDPMLKAWDNAFPDLFKDKNDFPDALLPHIRYPQDMFISQTNMWTRYVIDDPKVFIQGDTAWSIANEPSNAPVGEEDSSETVDVSKSAMRPYYIYNQVPSNGSEQPEYEYVLQRYFAPKNSDSGDRAKHLTAVMMARSDIDNYGELVLVNVPSGEVQTPDIVDTEIRKLAPLTEYKKQRQGNKVDFGEMNLLFAGDNILYVRSVYAESGGSGNIPELVRVVAATGDIRRSMGETINEAVNGLIDSKPLSEASESNEIVSEEIASNPDTILTPVDDPETVLDALEKANGLLAQADSAELSGDVEGAAKLRAEASAALEKGLDLIGGG